MDRRWFGVVVVIGVLLVAVLGADPLVRRLAGNPAPVTVSGAPAVGDCVTSLPTVERGTELDERIDYPAAEYGPCDQPIVGEVSSVNEAGAPAATLSGADYWPLSSQCALDAIGYTDSIPPVVAQGAGRPGILWRSSVAFDYIPVGPNRAQRALGQHWSACIVGSPDATPFAGRLRAVLSEGVLPAVFGSCWSTTSARNSAQIPCGQSHSVELLGSTILRDSPAADTEIAAACTVYAGRVLRTADPTRQGAIDIEVEIVGFDRAYSAEGSGANEQPDREVSCFAKAAAGSQFNGTLVGIAGRPLPLVK
ncbi:MAG: hypothetical protein ABWZ98_03695 [Nakamurella sp.]